MTKHEYQTNATAEIRSLLAEFQSSPSSCENNDLEKFLDALASWVEDYDGYYSNLNQAMPSNESFKLLVNSLRAAAIYE